MELLASSNSTVPVPKPPGDAIDSLYPAIVQCFTIILLGYVTGRAGWITSTHAKGLNTFTSKFALPALLFKSMATLNWDQVEWQFLGAIFISKASLFLVVLVFTLVVHRPVNIGLAGLAGIFVTQSNDFALGYPIVQAIYGKTQPQFLQYIYLVAPISLVILNPIGFILLEIQKARAAAVKRSPCLLLLKVVKEVSSNPIIVMTAAGVIANFIFKHHLPLIILNLLSTLGQAFSACALFILGLSIVGKFKKSMMPLLMGSGLLIFAKLLVFPLLTMEVTRALGCGSSTNSTADYSMFGFLYGTFPSAPSVFLYSTQYGVGEDLIATSLVLGTVASAPLMFTSAMMFGMQVFTMNVEDVLSKTSFDVAVLALICTVAVILLFCVTRRALRMPQVMVLIIAILQTLLAVAVALDEAFIDRVNKSSPIQWWEYMKFLMKVVGMLGASTMTTVTAATMYAISCHSLCRALVLRPWLLCYGLGLPVLSAGVILMLGSVTQTPEHGRLLFGHIQLGVIAVVMILNILLSVVILVVRRRRAQRVVEARTISSSFSSDASLISVSSSGGTYGTCSTTDPDSREASLHLSRNVNTSAREDKQKLVDVEDIVPFPAGTSIQDERMCLISDRCSAERRRKCKALLDNYDAVNGDNIVISGKDYQFGQLMALLVLLILSQITIVLFYIWQLFILDLVNTSVFIEVEFIYVVLSTGQGFFTFIVFGLDSQLVLLPIKRLVLKIISRIRGRRASMNFKPSPAALHLCQRFRDHHLEHCMVSIVEMIGSKPNCFYGNMMVSWLIDAGLAEDVLEAQVFGDQLLQGGVIKTISRCYSLMNSRYVYQFIVTPA